MAAGKLLLARGNNKLRFVYLFARVVFEGRLADPGVAHSRPSLKKYLKANHKNLASSDTIFDTQFNKAIKSGVEKGDFAQPKGTSTLAYIISHLFTGLQSPVIYVSCLPPWWWCWRLLLLLHVVVAFRAVAFHVVASLFT